MTRSLCLAVCSVASLGLGLSVPASAQSVRYRRPYAETYRLNYGFDHDGGAGGCTDYACGGSCYDGHTGSDLGAPFGTTVLAAADGVVTGTNDGCANYGSFGNTCGGRCGNHVRIRHDDGSTSIYCHMELGSIRVSYGQHVSCGQAIGSSASSGSSTGPHLHFGHTTAGSYAASDPWAGGCSRSTTLWVDQGGYRGPPSAACSGPACSPSAEDCNGRDDDCDGRIDESLVRSCGSDVGECVSGTQSCRDAHWDACAGGIGPAPERCNRLDDDCDGATDDDEVCERDEVTWGMPVYAVRGGGLTDVDGDGRADACAQSEGGFSCLLASEHGFDGTLEGGSDAGDDLARAASIRLGDVDGDGRADVCALEGERFVCRRSTGTTFAPSFVGPIVSPTTHGELVDLDGDGRDDLCLRDGAGLACHLASAHGLDHVTLLSALSDEAGYASITHWGSIRFGDVDGDGRADVCARDAEGVDCWLGDGAAFGERIRGPRWSDASGFDALGHWSTLRLADVDGDGRDDVCARTPSGFACAVSVVRALDELVLGPAMAGPSWDRPDGYATIRMADVDGDGRADVCAREDEHLRCWLATERGLDRVVEGPALRDADGFDDASVRYRSLRLADVDGDGRADFCARHADGLRCAASTGHGFDRTWLAIAWSDASVLGDGTHAASIRIGGTAARSVGSGGLVGVMSCRAGAPSRARPASVLGFLALALVLRSARGKRRRVVGPSTSPAPVSVS